MNRKKLASKLVDVEQRRLVIGRDCAERFVLFNN